MIKYLCDIQDCGKEAQPPTNNNDWTSQEMFDVSMEGASYFWARVGFANITLCTQHRTIAMNILADTIKSKYHIVEV